MDNIYSRKYIEGKILKWDGTNFYDTGGKKIELNIFPPQIPLIGVLEGPHLTIIDLDIPNRTFGERLRMMKRFKRYFEKIEHINISNFNFPPLESDEVLVKENWILPGKIKLRKRDLKMEVVITKLIIFRDRIEKYKCLTPTGKQIFIKNILCGRDNKLKVGDRILVGAQKIIDGYPQNAKMLANK